MWNVWNHTFFCLTGRHFYIALHFTLWFADSHTEVKYLKMKSCTPVQWNWKDLKRQVRETNGESIHHYELHIIKKHFAGLFYKTVLKQEEIKQLVTINSEEIKRIQITSLLFLSATVHITSNTYLWSSGLWNPPHSSV